MKIKKSARLLFAAFLFSIIFLGSCSKESSISNDQTETSVNVDVIQQDIESEPTSNAFNSIENQILEKASKNEKLSEESLPNWHGTALIPEYFTRKVNEKDIENIASYGFNYVRLHYGYRILFDEKTLEPKQSKFEELDQIISWGITYGVHINLVLYELPGSRDDIMTNEEHYKQALEIWSYIANRYNNVSSTSLSYNLLNEPGYDVFTENEYANFANALAEIIWQFDASKILVSDGMMGQGWDGAVASQPIENVDSRIVQSLHFYPFHFLRRSAHLSLFNWPYEEGLIVNNMISRNSKPFKISGNFPAGTELHLYLSGIDDVNNGGKLILKSNDKTVDEVSLDGIRNDDYTKVFVDEANSEVLKADFGDNGAYNGKELKFTIEQNSDTISFKLNGSDNLRIYLREIMIDIPTEEKHFYPVIDNTKVPQGFIYKEGNFRTIYIPCADIFSNTTSEVLILDDGSVESKPKFEEVDVFDLKTMEDYFSKWRKWGETNHIRIMCNEFSIPIAFPKEIRLRYLSSLLEVMKKNEIPWAVHNAYIEGWGPIISENELRYGRLVLPTDNSVLNFEGFYVDQLAIDLIKAYNLK